MNSESAPAYALSPKHALAQYAATGCFGRTFYATAGEQLKRVLELCDALSKEGALIRHRAPRRNLIVGENDPKILGSLVLTNRASPQYLRRQVNTLALGYIHQPLAYFRNGAFLFAFVRVNVLPGNVGDGSAALG